MECCKVLTFTVPSDGESIAFYKARGVKVILTSINPIHAIAVVPHVCSKLTSFGCSIYKDRPLSCAVFDGRKSPAVKDICLWNKEQ